VLTALLAWGDRHRQTNSRVFEHAVCGSRLDDAGHCPECHVTPGPEDIVTRRRRGRGQRRDPVSVALREPHRLLEPLET
jgi:hypothetical protein